MEKHQILSDLARIQLLEFDPSEEESYAEEENMEKKLPWLVPTREARDLILAEEIIRFASITDRPCTSQTHKITLHDMPDSTADTLTQDSEQFPCNMVAETTSREKDKDLEPITTSRERVESKVKYREITATDTGATSSAMRFASETGKCGSEPPQSASFRLSQPLASNFQDAYFPTEAKIPTDPQPNTSSEQLLAFRPNAIPVTNKILAAIAQNALEQTSSSHPVKQQVSGCIERKDSRRKTSQLFGYFLENVNDFQESDLSRSSSSDSIASASPSPSELPDKLSALNQHLLITTELEEMITKNIKRERDKTGVEEERDNPQENQQEEPKGLNHEINTNQQEAMPAGHADAVDNIFNQPVVEHPIENDSHHIAGNNPNLNNVEVVHAIDVNDATSQPEFPGEDYSSRPEWTRPEKRRLGTVIRDLSREIKTKELQQKKARLLKKGRIIAQAIENKICDINKDITAVNKKSLRHVALPLDQIQDYDWVRVATVLKAKRSPEECRTYWKCFLHPTINGSEWSLIEVKEMEVIAERHNFRNWDDIARELNTGRSGYQCYTFYRKHLCPHSELRITCSKK